MHTLSHTHIIMLSYYVVPCVHNYIGWYLHTHTLLDTPICTHTHTHVFSTRNMHVFMYIFYHTHTRIHPHTHTHTLSLTHTHTHIHSYRSCCHHLSMNPPPLTRVKVRNCLSLMSNLSWAVLIPTTTKTSMTCGTSHPRQRAKVESTPP